MIYLCVTPERQAKTSMLMRALATGCPGACRVVEGEPPEDDRPFVVWGQEWLTLRTVPGAARQGRPFWMIDNGYWQPGRGSPRGYYRFTYRGVSPVLLPPTVDLRPPPPIRPWRENGRHVLLAMPGIHFGLALGFDVEGWCRDIEARLRQQTSRPIIVRERNSQLPLGRQLADAWALVTHSSNVAVDAAIAGVPVFVAPTSPAAPVGRTDLEIEDAVRPGRKWWLRSLASQHFTVAEMANGVAWRWMARIARQVDVPDESDRPVAH